MSRTSFAHAILAIMVALFISESVGTLVNYVILRDIEDSNYASAFSALDDDPGSMDFSGESSLDGDGNIDTSGVGSPTNVGGTNPPNTTGGINPPTNVGGQDPACPQGRLCNPLKSQTIEAFLGKIIDVLIVFALPIIVLFIMYAGFLYVTARGDTGKLETARSALLWAVVGGVIILGAHLISRVLLETVKTF